MMARRRAPHSPPAEAQRAAFYAKTGGKHYQGLNTSDQAPSIYNVIRWIIEQHKAARNHNTEILNGTPPKFDRMIAATNWLERAGVKLSDAPGSRCVAELVSFLNRWETDHLSKGKKPKNNKYTAETLAGTLLAYEQDLIIGQ